MLTIQSWKNTVVRTSFILLITLLLASLPGQAQIVCDTSLLKLFLTDTSSYKRFNTSKSLIWDRISDRPGTALLANGTLYYLPDLEGAVFKAVPTGDSVLVSRVDRTVFSGNNRYQYCFVNDGKIYSFGGYGFWRTNGQLRLYLEDKFEWDIIRLNQEIHSYLGLTYYDHTTQTLWSCSQDYVNEALAQDGHARTWNTYRMKISEKNWEKAGDFFLQDGPPSSNYRFITETPFGPLMLSAGPKFQVLNFEQNKVYDVPALSDSLMLYNQHQPKQSSVYCINNNIILYDVKDKNGKAKMFPILSEMLVDTQKTIYTTSRRFSLPTSAEIIALFLTSLLGIYFVVRSFRNRQSKGRTNVEIKKYVTSPVQLPRTDPNDQSPTASFMETLTPLEMEVVNQIIKDNSDGNGTRTELINKVLGTERKSPDVQKKQRSDILLSINSKFQLFYRVQSGLIDIKRSEEDRRIFEYHIQGELISQITYLPQQLPTNK